jgi:aldose 1-epimerase
MLGWAPARTPSITVVADQRGIGTPDVVDTDHSSNYQVEPGQRGDVHLYVLRDRRAGSEAHLAPGLGNSCVRFAVTVDGTSWAVLAEPPNEVSLRQQTTRFGIPILYPWPNRIKGGRFTFRGETHSVPPNSAGGHANHGLVRTLPWKVDGSGTDPRGAWVRATVEVGGRGTEFPFPSRLTVEYRLRAATLAVSAVATNFGDGAMPIGFGLHPWFEVPLGPSGTRGACEVRVPARRFWELRDWIPTGRILPAAGPRDLRDWTALGSTELDDVFTDLAGDGEWFTAELRDPSAGRRVVVRSDRRFLHHVVFAPRERDVVCLEPYTCATDAFNLTERGIESGVMVLNEADSWSGRVEIEAIANEKARD